MTKLNLALLGSIAGLLILAGIAQARTGLSASPTLSTEYIHNMEFSGGFNTVRCDITQTVSLHSSVAKRAGELAGFVTLALSTNACSSGNMGLFEARGARVTGLQGPYHLIYNSFGGELPNIIEVTMEIVGVHFWIEEPFGVTCTSTESIALTTTGGNPATGWRVNRAGIRLEGGCGFTSMTLRGAGEIFRELAHAIRASLSISLL